MGNLDPTGLASLALGEVFRVGKDAAVNVLNMKKLAKQLDEEHLQELVPIVQGIVSMVDSMDPNHEDMRGVMQKLETELVDMQEHVSRCRQSGTWNPFKRLSNSKKIIKGKGRIQGSQIVATFLSLKMAMVASASAPASSSRFYCPPVPQHQVVIGMGDYMLKLQSLLLDEGGNQWICVSGMGGVGKTLLVQMVCSIPEVRDHFQNRILWVRLGPGPQVIITELQRDLCEQLSRRPARLLQDDRDGRMVLSNLVSKQRYLVILDNAWKRSMLEPFDIIGNHNGSKVVVTSRKKDILAESGARASRIDVEALSYEDSYTLFCHHAFQEMEAPPNLEKYVWELVRRCGGVPLVVEVVAKAMASKHEPRQWEYVLRKIAKGKFEGQQHVFEMLRLSYDELHPFHQKCFLLLAAQFRQGSVDGENFQQEFLIFNSWRCLQDDDDDDDFEMECYEALRSLEKASLIKAAPHFHSLRTWKMRISDDDEDHRSWGVVNLLSELAMWIVEKDKLPYILSARQQSWEWQSLEMVCLEPDPEDMQRLLNPSLPEITGGPATSMSFLRLEGDYELANDYFDLLPNLRVLSLATSGEMPDSLGSLRHLHVLDLWCKKQVTELPNNLVYATLDFSRHSADIGSLCAALHQLTKLECLHLYLGESSHVDLSFLESTSKLRDLLIVGRRSSSGIWTTKATSCFHFKNLFHLKQLRLLCKADFLPVDVLESLTKVEHFEVSEIERMVDWDCQTLKNLKRFKLGICPKTSGKCLLGSLSCSALSLKELLLPVQMECCKVPPLDNFHSLKKLQVSLAVRCLPQSFGSSQAFPLLRELILNGCGLLAELPALGELPQLRYLELSECAFERLSESFAQFPALETMEIKDCRALVELPALDGLQKLTHLTLEGLSSLQQLPSLDGLQKLTHLTLDGLSSLAQLPSLDGLRNLESLTLKALPCLPDTFGSSKRLSLEECPPFPDLNPGTLPGLWRLEIRRCGMKHLPQSLTVLTGLHSLSVRDCDELETLPPATFAPFMDFQFLAFDGCNRSQSCTRRCLLH